MAYLSDEARAKVRRALARYWSDLRELVILLKADLLAAVVATDVWIEDNQASYNQALPEEARTNLALEQKTLLFCAVACARVSIDFLRRVFGNVD